MKHPVKIYETNHPYSPYEVHYLFDGKKVKKRFSKHADALLHKKEMEAIILAEGVKGLNMKIDEREEWKTCVSILEGSQVDVLQAVKEWRKAFDTLHPLGLSLHQIVKEQQEKRAIHGEVQERPTLPEALAVFLSEKGERGKRSVRTLGGLKNRLEGVIENGCNSWQKWNRDALQKAVSGRKLSARSEINELAAIRNFSNWCINKGWLASDPTERIERPRTETPLPQILTPLQFEKLIATAKELEEGLSKANDVRVIKGGNYWAWYLVLGLTGLRPSELEGMIKAGNLASKVSEGELKVVHVGKKNREVRSVPVPPSLLVSMDRIGWNFIKPTPKKHRLIYLTAGIKWQEDILRHSWISYRLKKTQDKSKTSLEAGNSPAVIQRFYAVSVNSSDADKWFKVG